MVSVTFREEGILSSAVDDNAEDASARPIDDEQPCMQIMPYPEASLEMPHTLVDIPSRFESRFQTHRISRLQTRG